ncbi:MAG: hypothetical protein ABWW70_04405 [Thermoproteota archaeon]
MGTVSEDLLSRGATEAAEKVLSRFTSMVSASKSAWDLLAAIDYLESKMVSRPFSALLINTVRNILTMLLSIDEGQTLDSIKSKIASRVSEVYVKVAEATEGAAEVASRRIEHGDVVITFSYSRSVLRALQKAKAEGKNISVIVAESRPLGEGVEMAKALAEFDIPVTLIVDSAMRYTVKKATKALVGADAIAADGSVIARTGVGLLALAAAEARVGMIVVAGTYKLYPETAYGLQLEVSSLSEEVVPEDLRVLGVRGYAPLFEAVQPHLIDALATEKGLMAPEAVPLLIQETYGQWPPRVEPVRELFSKAKQKLRGLLGVEGP